MAKIEIKYPVDYRMGGDTVDDFATKIVDELAKNIIPEMNNLREHKAGTLEPAAGQIKFEDGKIYARNNDNTEWIYFGDVKERMGIDDYINDKSKSMIRRWVDGEESPDDELDEESPTGKTQSARSWALNARSDAASAASSKAAARASQEAAAASETAAIAAQRDARSSAQAAATSAINLSAAETNAIAYGKSAMASAQAAAVSQDNAYNWAMSTTTPDGKFDADSATGKTQSSRTWALYSRDRALAAQADAAAAARSEAAAKASEDASAASEAAAKASEEIALQKAQATADSEAHTAEMTNRSAMLFLNTKAADERAAASAAAASASAVEAAESRRAAAEAAADAHVDASLVNSLLDDAVRTVRSMESGAWDISMATTEELIAGMDCFVADDGTRYYPDSVYIGPDEPTDGSTIWFRTE
jgi:hypothetical protein